jgi:magnesium chelatase accessory protein
VAIVAEVARVRTRSVEWHTEITGSGPEILLVHGTAASSHSWRKLVPLLARNYRVLNLDLPGHGKSASHAPTDMGLDGMAAGLKELLQKLQFNPAIVVGHSAGAVILVRLCARLGYTAEHLVSFNGAFFPFAGAAGSLFSPIAKLVALTPFLPHLLSAVATRQTAERLLRDTGSVLAADDIDAYFELFKKSSHISAALHMMANWDLSEVTKDLAVLKVKCTFVAGGKDSTVPPGSANRAAAFCRLASAHVLPGFGHLLHEEQPALAAAIIRGEYAWPS